MPVDVFDFADLRYINIEVRDVFCLGRKVGWIAGNPVVEPGADRDQEITIFDGVIGKSHAVHAKHMQ